MSKGSSPRPYSVSQDQFADNWDAIFNKDKHMTPSVESMKKGTCGCGRSPTGNCIGWHSLTEEDYKAKLASYELENYKNQAQELWADSCTTGRTE
jgi:hypothetical protein